MEFNPAFKGLIYVGLMFFSSLEQKHLEILTVKKHIPIYCWYRKRFFLLVVIVGIIVVGIVVTKIADDDRRHCYSVQPQHNQCALLSGQQKRDTTPSIALVFSFPESLLLTKFGVNVHCKSAKFAKFRPQNHIDNIRSKKKKQIGFF